MSVRADDLKKHLENLQQSIRGSWIKPGDMIAMHPSMVRHFGTLTEPEENPLGFSRSVGYLHKMSGIPVLQIEEVEPGIFELGSYEAFCIKYPEWWKRELEARKLLEEMREAKGESDG